ncbi:MAG: hypothetical protein U0Y68_00665 [Blastocatellia bacterium]
MFKRRVTAFISLLLLLAVSPIAFGQTTTRPAAQPIQEDVPFGPPSLDAVVERVSGEYRLRITNNDSARRFQGLAVISLGTSFQQAEAGKVKLAIGPQEMAIHLLYSMPVVGDQYMLVITDQTGTLVVHKIAPVQVINDASLAAPPPKAVSMVPVATEESIPVKVKVRLAGGAGENDPYLLGFELSSPNQIANARLAVKAKGLDDSKPVSFSGKTNVEFKLSEDLEVQKISYTLTGSRGEILAKGETDLATLMTEDVVTINGMRMDKPSYKPGETAKMTVSYLGNVPNGIRVELVVTDSTGKTVFRDIRKEKKEGALPAHEFIIPIPKDVQESLNVDFKIFEGDTQQIIDSGTRDIQVSRN